MKPALNPICVNPCNLWFYYFQFPFNQLHTHEELVIITISGIEAETCPALFLLAEWHFSTGQEKSDLIVTTVWISRENIPATGSFN